MNANEHNPCVAAPQCQATDHSDSKCCPSKFPPTDALCVSCPRAGNVHWTCECSVFTATHSLFPMMAALASLHCSICEATMSAPVRSNYTSCAIIVPPGMPRVLQAKNAQLQALPAPHIVLTILEPMSMPAKTNSWARLSHRLTSLLPTSPVCPYPTQ